MGQAAVTNTTQTPAGNSLVRFTPTIGSSSVNFTTSLAEGTLLQVGDLYLLSARINWNSTNAASGGCFINLPVSDFSTAFGITVSRCVGFTPAGSSVLTATTYGAGAYQLKLSFMKNGSTTGSPILCEQVAQNGVIEFSAVLNMF